MVHHALAKLAQPFCGVLPSVVQQIIARICLGRNPLLSRPRNEAAYGFVPKKRLPRSESFRQGERVVRSVDGAVAGTTNVDRSIQHSVGIPLLPIALVRAPENRCDESSHPGAGIVGCKHKHKEVWNAVQQIMGRRSPGQVLVGVSRRGRHILG